MAGMHASWADPRREAAVMRRLAGAQRAAAGGGLEQGRGWDASPPACVAGRAHGHERNPHCIRLILVPRRSFAAPTTPCRPPRRAAAGGGARGRGPRAPGDGAVPGRRAGGQDHRPGGGAARGEGGGGLGPGQRPGPGPRRRASRAIRSHPPPPPPGATRQGGFPEAEAARVARALLEVVAHAHDLGCIHRDIKVGGDRGPVLSGREAPLLRPRPPGCGATVASRPAQLTRPPPGPRPSPRSPTTSC
jgi:hypothetical protein